MSGFFDTDFGSPIPWMAEAEPDEWTNFELEISSLTPIDSDVPFGQGYNEQTGKLGRVTEATANMKNFEKPSEVGDSTIEDGEHVIPFWACGALQELLTPLLRKHKGKWITLNYRRQVVQRKGKENSVATFELDVNV